MTEKSRIPGTVDAWESGALGTDEKHVRRVSAETAQQIDDALGLQPISIRLPKSTIETYKMLAKLHGVGYQPLMRDAICRWAEAEMKQVLIGALETQRQQTAEAAPDNLCEVDHDRNQIPESELEPEEFRRAA